jgi:hypothetical protein
VILRFRRHHFLCSLGFQGKGYSDAFTANMDAVVNGRLRAPQGAAKEIEVVAGADAICAPCPERRGEGCAKQARIDRLDAAHGAALGLAPGDRISWGDALARIRARVQPGDLARICKGCGWLELGLCEAALGQLHAGEG